MSKPPAKSATRAAKGAVRETIGKLLGDDAAVRKGRAEQRTAPAPTDPKDTE